VRPPCLIFEDDHLLVVNKPAGLNTHAQSPFAGEGLYEWLKHREPRWANLAIIHRLDKETSGLILFSKTALANRSLTEQFTTRSIHKRYLFLTDRAVPSGMVDVKTALVRLGDKYLSRPIGAGSEFVETRFILLKRPGAHDLGPGTLVQAEPFTGRTHQIRVHAADKGFAIVGDTRYGGTPSRLLCLHAAELAFRHPASGKKVSFEAPVDFISDPRLTLRRALINSQSTTAYRLIHGASDGWPECYVDLLGPYLLAQSARPIEKSEQAELSDLAKATSSQAAYAKKLLVTPKSAEPEDLSPKLLFGSAAPDRFSVIENGLKFQLSFAEGYSVGLFLDQRDNRRRLLSRHVAAEFPLCEPERPAERQELLNTFAYTCGFSVAAAKAGLRTTSLDLAKKYLEWGKRNFEYNHIDPADHDFIFGGVFDWLRRFRKKGRAFDVILLDPPTFSRSKEFGAFRVQKDYAGLISAALPLLKPRGVLFASCNAANWPPEAFLDAVKQPILAANRIILREQYFPQAPDFPVSRGQPAYLKTIWMRIA